MRKERVHHEGNLIRHEEVVIHQPVDIHRIRVVVAAGAGPIFHQPIGGMMLVLNARVIRKIAVHHLRRLRIMRVVCDEDVQITICLGKYTFKREAEVVRALERRDNDRHKRVNVS